MRFPTKSDLLRAHERIAPFVHRTPVLTCTSIDEWLHAKVFFKCENFQKVGAFKARGGINAVLAEVEGKKVHAVVTHSSGNHAQAVALAARIAGIKAYVVMPIDAPKVKRAATLGYGAEIIDCGPSLEAREVVLADVKEKTGATEIHPYDDFSVIAGQATVAKELVEQVEGLEVIITPVGGGGLLAGTILTAKYFAPGIEVYAGEPDGADDAYQSINQGKHLPSVSPETIAEGLLTSLGARNYAIIKDGVRKIIRVSDEDIVEALITIWERMKIIVEPSGAVPLAAVKKAGSIFEGMRIGAVLTGGNIDILRMSEIYSRSKSGE